MSPAMVLLGTAGTLALFLLMRRVARALGGPALANPVAATCAILIAGAHIAGASSVAIADAAWPLRWALGPAIVALAVPIAQGWAGFAGRRAALLGTVALGSLAGIASAVLCARMVGLGAVPVMALSSKSATSPFAIAIMERLGGPAALAAGASIVTGMLGAMLLPPLLKRLRLADDATMGLAMGQAAHIVGTDALGRTQPGAARVAGLALALAGLATAAWLGLLWPWVRG